MTGYIDELPTTERALARSMLLGKDPDLCQAVDDFRAKGELPSFLARLRTILKTEPETVREPEPTICGVPFEGAENEQAEEAPVSAHFAAATETETEGLGETEAQLRQLLAESKEYLGGEKNAPAIGSRHTPLSEMCMNLANPPLQNHSTNSSSALIPNGSGGVLPETTPENFSTPSKSAQKLRSRTQTPASKFAHVPIGRLRQLQRGKDCKQTEKENACNPAIAQEFDSATFRKPDQGPDGSSRGGKSLIFVAPEVRNEVTTPTESLMASTLQTEELFKEYVGENRAAPVHPKENTLVELGCETGLRYVALRDLMAECKRAGLINRARFLAAVQAVPSLVGGNQNKKMKMMMTEDQKGRLRELYDIMARGKADGKPEEFAGGLALLCAVGTVRERVGAALESAGACASLGQIVTFLRSLFRLLIAVSPHSTKNANVSEQDLANMTARQCFDDHKIHYDSPLELSQFISWFSAQGRVLAPRCEPAEHLAPHQKIEVDVEPVHHPRRHKTTRIAEASVELDVPVPTPYPFDQMYAPPPNFVPWSCAGTNMPMKTGWPDIQQQFMYWYCATYGLYPQMQVPQPNKDKTCDNTMNDSASTETMGSARPIVAKTRVARKNHAKAVSRTVAVCSEEEAATLKTYYSQSCAETEGTANVSTRRAAGPGSLSGYYCC